jgi:tryptophan synthase alpha subunit
MLLTEQSLFGQCQTVLISVVAVTGAGAATLKHVVQIVTRLPQHTDLSISIGYDIYTPGHAITFT